MIDTNKFEWPEFKSEFDRIKKYTQKYKEVSLAEAFNSVYDGLNCAYNDDMEINRHVNVKVGDVIDINIIFHDNGNIEFYAGAMFKQQIVCINNYKKWPAFKNHCKNNDIIQCKACIVKQNKNNNIVNIDIIKPIIDSWLVDRLNKDINKYNDIAGRGNPDKLLNLKLIDKGYSCNVNIEDVSEFIGEPYYIEGFIPGSQIVLNIEKDFSVWDGQDVPGMIIGISTNQYTGDLISVICSRKKYVSFLGNCELKRYFEHWCDDDQEWHALSEISMEGVITGVLNSNNKCGIFIEIPDKNITGMVNLPKWELSQYHPGDIVPIQLSDFDVETYFDSVLQQKCTVVPFNIKCDENGNKHLLNCRIKPVFKIIPHE